MANRRKTPAPGAAYWRRAQPMIKELYLEQNQSAEYIASQLIKEFKVDIRARQVKGKFRDWGFDDKRINCKAYDAMLFVIEQTLEDINFEVIRRRGHSRKTKPAHEIRKQVKRQKRDTSSCTWGTVKDALDFLRAADIRPLRTHKATIITYLTTHQLSSQGIEFGREHMAKQGDTSSTTSEDSQSDIMELKPDNLNFQDDSYPHRGPMFNTQDFDLELSGGSQRPRMSNQVPYLNTFTANLHANVFPQTLENQMRNELPVSIFSQFDTTAIPMMFPADGMSDDLTLPLADLVFELDMNKQRKALWEKFLGIELRQIYRHHLREEKARVIEFVAYYIQQTLAGYDTLDEYDHVDRQEARSKLRGLLVAGNQEIFPAINWVSAVIGSHDKSAQLSAFFEDCYACVTDNDCYLALVVKPAIKFALSTDSEARRTAGVRSRPSDPRVERTEILIDDFDAGETEFNQSLSLLKQRGSENSAVYLLLCYYYAWYLLQRDCNAGRALGILMDCYNSAERLMGRSHLVTVNCYALAARAYSLMGDTPLARSDLELAISRLSNCPSPLRAHFYRLKERRAVIDISHGDHHSALLTLKEVFEFRLERLGPCSGPTWEAARKMWEVLKVLGRAPEADLGKRTLQAQHDNEWYRMQEAKHKQYDKASMRMELRAADIKSEGFITSS